MIYLDIDGVLADFEGFVLEQTGKPYSRNSWEELENIPYLFAKLKVLPDAMYLVEELRKIDEITILGALPLPTKQLLSAAYDKYYWLLDTFPEHAFSNIILVESWKDKAKYANVAGAGYLIDDSYRNVKDFADHMGQAILHTDAESTLKQLKKIHHNTNLGLKAY